VVRAAAELGVEDLTLYAFSTENWRRSADEVRGLMSLLVHTLKREVAELGRANVRLDAIGRLESLPEAVRHAVARATDDLKGNTGLRLHLALNYGGRQEIVDAVRALVRDGVTDVNEEVLASRLYTAGRPDPDLLIRTSGESRVSNFLLWQCAYAEIYITPTLWPDFRRNEFFEAIVNFQSRDRRFGK
jgi:undecaprenyl diphosphate synthase